MKSNTWGVANSLAQNLLGPTYGQALLQWLKMEVINELAPLDREQARNRPLFVHIPKAAGTSVLRLPVFNVKGHKPWSFYERKLGAQRCPVSFAIVRHPCTRLASAFHYLKSGGRHAYDRLWARKHLAPFDDIEEFATQGLSRPEILQWMHFKPQYTFVTDRQGTVRVDHLIRYERLQEEWPLVAEKLGLPKTLPHRNAGPRPSHAPLSERARESIFRAYRKDFELFGYEP